MNTARALKKDFVASDDLRRRYPEIEPTMIGLMKQRSALWARMGADDFEDLMQEARCALLGIIESYDGERSFATYLRASMDNVFANLVRAKLARCRCAWIESRDAETGEKKMIPCPTVSMSTNGDGLIEMGVSVGQRVSGLGQTRRRSDSGGYGYEVIDQSPPPDDLVHEKRSSEQVDSILRLVRQHLSDFQMQVFDCIVEPAPELYALVRNLDDPDRIRSNHIALYLGTNQERVQWAIKRIYVIAKNIGRDLGVQDAVDE